MANINCVVLVGNLTRDPELRHTASGYAVCSLRIAVNDRKKDSQSGDWVDRPYFFDVTVWGNQGEACAQYLAKGQPVGVQGKLTWREWETQEGGKRQTVEVEAFTVQFLRGRENGGGGGGGGGSRRDDFVPASAAASNEFQPAGATTATDDFNPATTVDDDIPF